jgi:hypothetical protein
MEATLKCVQCKCNLGPDAAPQKKFCSSCQNQRTIANKEKYKGRYNVKKRGAQKVRCVQCKCDLGSDAAPQRKFCSPCRTQRKIAYEEKYKVKRRGAQEAVLSESNEHLKCAQCKCDLGSHAAPQKKFCSSCQNQRTRANKEKHKVKKRGAQEAGLTESNDAEKEIKFIDADIIKMADISEEQISSCILYERLNKGIVSIPIGFSLVECNHPVATVMKKMCEQKELVCIQPIPNYFMMSDTIIQVVMNSVIKIIDSRKIKESRLV